jgi:nucleotide-binding universal stress UspA family protein
MFKTIVLGLDGSPDSERAVPYAVDLAGDSGRIVAVYVREIVFSRAGAHTAVPNEDEVESAVSKHVDDLAAKGVKIELKMATSVAGGPGQALADAAQVEHADVIVVGTRGYSQIAGLLVGSVTQRLLHIAHCPVLAVPRSAAASATDTQSESAAAAT